MKLLLDFLPLVLFFATFRYTEGHPEAAAAFANEHFGFLMAGGTVGQDQAPVLLATIVVILATIAQIVILKLRGRKVDLMLWVSFVMVVVLGGLTIYFHSETFIKWKPSGVYWTLGLAFWISQAVFGKNLLKTLIGQQIELPDQVWRRLNLAWVLFFGFMGVLNLWVVYHYSTSTWVSFKAFGTTALMFVFFLGQGLYLNKYLPDESQPANPSDKPRSES
ncbi:septation protein A [Ideonella sp. DXS29W]|uniref:Inner membrane-spanning protein YciB n=1 Tax=Ideonella lacteola TaxID=2984193 RepID=A0ABU9BU60_9BURK